MAEAFSDRCVLLVKKYEGFRAQAYKCPAGVWTIGWGWTHGVKPGQICTKEQADGWLRQELSKIAGQLHAAALARARVLSQCQMDALCSFAYNTGVQALLSSTLWRLLMEGKPLPVVAQQFDRWVKAGGTILPGLVKRRAEEKELFLSDDEP